MFSQAVLLALLSLLDTSSASCQGSELTAVLKCYEKWLGEYGMVLPTRTTLPDWITFHNIRMGILANNGKASQPEICEHGHELVMCLKDHWNCMDNKMFEILGQSKKMAKLYHDDAYITRYLCSERGMELLMEKHQYECPKMVRDEKGGDVAAANCSKNLKGFIEQAGGDECKGNNLFLQCVYDVYINDCGDDGGRVMCETARAAVLSQVEWCGAAPSYDIVQCPPVPCTASQQQEQQQQPSVQQPRALQQVSSAAGVGASWTLLFMMAGSMLMTATRH